MRGVEGSADLAVLRLTAPAGDVAPLRFDEAGSLRVGDPVVAIGTPFGLQGSLSSGIVSGLRRQIDSPNGFAITGVIQTDAALNPGNSGGPLLDLQGRVVGVATQIATEGGRNEGIGFAVPSDVVRRIAAALIADGHASLPYLGISGADAGDGVLLGDVLASGPAVGVLRPADVIVAVDGDAVTTNATLAAVLAGHAPGDDVPRGRPRDGRALDLTVTLARRPSPDPSSPSARGSCSRSSASHARLTGTGHAEPLAGADHRADQRVALEAPAGSRSKRVDEPPPAGRRRRASAT